MGSSHSRAAVTEVTLVAIVVAVIAATLGVVPSARVSALPTIDSPSATALGSVATDRLWGMTRTNVTQTVAYCGNGSIDGASSIVTSVVIMVHGDSRNSCDYARYTLLSAKAAGVGGSTLVVAPRFITKDDAAASNDSAMYWSDGGWKQGDASLTSPYPRAWTASSYDVIDAMIQHITEPGLFPSLARVVVAGHSAGGQFTNRYAATTHLSAAATPGVARSYVVANPSSYLYLTSLRPVGGALRALTSSEVSKCSSYDRYKYGLQRLNPYVAATTTSTIRSQYATSRVTYLLGGADTLQDSALDTSCGARWEGLNRLVRGQNYFAALGPVLGTGVYNSQRQVVVPGVGHDGKTMFNSSQGQSALFN